VPPIGLNADLGAVAPGVSAGKPCKGKCFSILRYSNWIGWDNLHWRGPTLDHVISFESKVAAAYVKFTKKQIARMKEAANSGIHGIKRDADLDCIKKGGADCKCKGKMHWDRRISLVCHRFDGAKRHSCIAWLGGYYEGRCSR
jgi:hypothetical protein